MGLLRRLIACECRALSRRQHVAASLAGAVVILGGAVAATDDAPSASHSDPAGQYSDEFNADSLGEWSLRHQVEGGPAQYTALNINESVAGSLAIVPKRTRGWYQNQDAPLIYKDITGNFAVHTHVTADSIRRPGNAPSENFNSAGLMARNPAGDKDRENYVMVNVGTQNARQGAAVGSEIKTTRNAQSELKIDAGPNAGELVLCRVGKRFLAYRRLDGESEWQELGRYSRRDLPKTLQVGMVVSAFGGADLRASFDFIRLLPTPERPDDCLPE